MASERSGYVATSGATLHASWDALEHASERPSEQVRGLPKLELLRRMQLRLSQLQLWRRGHAPALRSRPVPTEEVGLRLRTARTLATGLASCSPGQAFSAATRYVQLAVDAQDSLHLVRALGLSAALGGVAGLGKRGSEQALARMDVVAQDDGSREAQGFASLIHGVVSHSHDEFAAARKHMSRALALLRGCVGVDWEIDQANLFDQMSANAAGDYLDSVRMTPALVEAAFRRGRVDIAALLSGVHGLAAWLAPDDPGAYRRVIAEAREHLRRTSSATWPEQCLSMGEAALCIYVGEPARGYDLLVEDGQIQRSSQSALLVLQRGMCAAAALSEQPAGNALGRRLQLRDAIERCIRTLTRYGGPTSLSAAESLRAALALDAGLWLQATHRLAAALQLQAAAGLEMSAAATRRRLGQLTGSAAGRRLVASADASMRAQGIQNLEAMTELLCPGLRR